MNLDTSASTLYVHNGEEDLREGMFVNLTELVTICLQSFSENSFLLLCSLRAYYENIEGR